MDSHAVFCNLLLLTYPGVCFGQELVLPDSIKGTVGDKVVITPTSIPDRPHLFIRWSFNTTNILLGPPRGIIIQAPYRDRVSLDHSTYALELSNLVENDTGLYSLIIENESNNFSGQTSLYVLETETTSGKTLSAGVIAGIVIGVLLSLAGIAGLIVYFIKVKEMPNTNFKGNKPTQSAAAHNTDKDDSNYENMVCFKNKNTAPTVGGSNTRHNPHSNTEDIYENL